MEKFYLEIPSIKRKNEALDYIQEFLDANSEIHGTGGLNRYLDDYEGWLIKLEEDYIRTPDKNHVPARTFFLIRKDDDKIVGMINIRLTLNEKLRKFAGHIGFSIRPKERNKGYNNINLYLGLKECTKHNIKKILLTAYKGNPASWKTMERFGGIRIKEEYIEEYHELTVFYEIDTFKAIKNNEEFEQYI